PEGRARTVAINPDAVVAGDGTSHRQGRRYAVRCYKEAVEVPGSDAVRDDSGDRSPRGSGTGYQDAGIAIAVGFHPIEGNRDGACAARLYQHSEVPIVGDDRG